MVEYVDKLLYMNRDVCLNDAFGVVQEIQVGDKKNQTRKLSEFMIF